MPIARIGYGTDFILKNQGVGVATDTTDVKLEVGGTTKANYNISGIASLTNYAGFAAAEQNIAGTVTLTGEHGTLGDIVVGIGSTFIVSSGSTVEVGTVPSVSIGTHFSPPTGDINDRPEVPVEGTVRYNKDLNTLEFYNGVDWRQFTVNGSSGRVVLGGGTPDGTPHVTYIQYLNINTFGNTQTFGDLVEDVDGVGGVASSIRGVFVGGEGYPAGGRNSMQYVTIASEGNAIDFGDLQQVARFPFNVSSSTRGIITGGQQPGYTTMINAIQIATTGNAVDTGGEHVGGKSLGCSINSPTRGVFVSGYDNSSPNVVNTISYLTIASNGSSVDFGSTTQRTRGTACSNSVRGCMGTGWQGPSNSSDGLSRVIDMITIASEGSLVNFGELSTAARSHSYNANAANAIRGLFCGGKTPTVLNVIDYITFSTQGNALDFGDLSGKDEGTTIQHGGGFSDSHGGLGGY